VTVAIDPVGLERYHIESGVPVSGSFRALADGHTIRGTIDYFIKRKFGERYVIKRLGEYGFVRTRQLLKGHRIVGWTEGSSEGEVKQHHPLELRDLINEIAEVSLRLLLLAGLGGLPLTLALGHEAHHAECNETTINALKADIQAMREGQAKTKARNEMEAAQQLMAKNDMKGCKNHVHSAMEATEK
jgi:hypothetical protein